MVIMLKSLRVYVEGCLDASLVSVLADLIRHNYGIEVEFEIGGLGGKTRVIDRLLDDLFKLRVIAFVDADKGVYDTMELIENRIRDKGLEKQLRLYLWDT